MIIPPGSAGIFIIVFFFVKCFHDIDARLVMLIALLRGLLTWPGTKRDSVAEGEEGEEMESEDPLANLPNC